MPAPDNPHLVSDAELQQAWVNPITPHNAPIVLAGYDARSSPGGTAVACGRHRARGGPFRS
jgi:hypothetical protein